MYVLVICCFVRCVVEQILQKWTTVDSSQIEMFFSFAVSTKPWYELFLFILLSPSEPDKDKRPAAKCILFIQKTGKSEWIANMENRMTVQTQATRTWITGCVQTVLTYSTMVTQWVKLCGSAEKAMGSRPSTADLLLLGPRASGLPQSAPGYHHWPSVFAWFSSKLGYVKKII